MSCHILWGSTFLLFIVLYDRLLVSFLILPCWWVQLIMYLLGDHDLKQWVISVPEVSFTSRTTDDEFIVLASDGLWDVWSNKALAEFVYKKLRERRKVINWHPSATSPAEFIAVQTVEEALCSRHSGDNISVIVVDLKWPKRRHKKVWVARFPSNCICPEIAISFCGCLLIGLDALVLLM